MTNQVSAEIVSNEGPMDEDRLKEVLRNWHEQHDPEKGVVPTKTGPVTSTSSRWKND